MTAPTVPFIEIDFSAPGVSPAISVDKGAFDLNIGGTWTGSISVERTYNDGITWFNVQDFTENASLTGCAGSGRAKGRLSLYRLNCTALDSGQANCLMTT